MDRGRATRIPEISEEELRRLPHVQFCAYRVSDGVQRTINHVTYVES